MKLSTATLAVTAALALTTAASLASLALTGMTAGALSAQQAAEKLAPGCVRGYAPVPAAKTMVLVPVVLCNSTGKTV